MSTPLVIPVGSTLALSAAIGIGRTIGFTAGTSVLTTEGPHCLQEGDNVIMCDVPTACIGLIQGQCVQVAKVESDTKIRLNIALPDKTKGSLIKAADLAGFQLVLRIGEPSERRYLNYGAVCKNAEQVLVQGCHDVPIGSTLSLGNVIVDSPVEAVMPGADGNNVNYTVIITRDIAPSSVEISDGKFAVVQTPGIKQFHGAAQQCGLIGVRMDPSATRQFKAGTHESWSLSLERGWDMTAFNKRHGVNCPWNPDFSTQLRSGTVHFV